MFINRYVDCTVWLLSFFTATACSDPGIVFEDPYELENGGANNLLECGKCNIKRPHTASHCYECGLCIDQIDHHCPVSTFVYLISVLLFNGIFTYVNNRSCVLSLSLTYSRSLSRLFPCFVFTVNPFSGLENALPRKISRIFTIFFGH